jgi:hypothetical protein
VIAKNISDDEADAAFRLIMEGLDKEMVEANNADAVWLVPGYKPTPAAMGALDTLKLGTPAYPASSRMGLIHTAIGTMVGDYLTGKATAEQTLAAIEDRYMTAAKEAGLIK